MLADQMHAMERWEFAQIIEAAVAAAVASVTPVPKKAYAFKRHINKTIKNYQQMLIGLQARATGTVGERFDARGREILRSPQQVASYIGQMPDTRVRHKTGRSGPAATRIRP